MKKKEKVERQTKLEARGEGKRVKRNSRKNRKKEKREPREGKRKEESNLGGE